MSGPHAYGTCLTGSESRWSPGGLHLRPRHARAGQTTLDERLVSVTGASHDLTTCKACKQFPGQYGDTVKIAFDDVASGLRGRCVSQPQASLRVRAWAAPEGPLGGSQGAELPFGWAGGADEPGRSMRPTGAGQSSTPRSER